MIVNIPKIIIIKLFYNTICYTNAIADVAELVDAHDSKSCDGNIMWVRLPPSAPLTFFLHIKKADLLTIKVQIKLSGWSIPVFFNTTSNDFLYFIIFP